MKHRVVHPVRHMLGAAPWQRGLRAFVAWLERERLSKDDLDELLRALPSGVHPSSSTGLRLARMRDAIAAKRAAR